MYILADISGSVSRQIYAAIKTSVKNLINNLGDAQTAKFYTFSQDVVPVLDGTESYEEACTRIDETEVTTNGYTALYDALYVVHEMAMKERDIYKKQLVLVFTDGVNEDNKAKRTYDETKNIYQCLDLPIYSMCMDAATSESKQILGELSRLSGGGNRVFKSGNINTELQNLLDDAFSSITLHFQKNNNKAEDKDKNLSVRINGVDLPVVTVYESAIRIQNDDTAPTYTAEYSIKDKCLMITFSENVVNANNTDAYIITDSSGKALAVESVKYDEQTHTSSLFFPDRFYAGEYTIALSGITDDSYAANAPANSITVPLAGDSQLLKMLEYWWLLLIPLLIAVIVLLVLLIVKRKRKITTVKELFEVENENNYEIKHHIVNAAKGKEIKLDIATGNVDNVIKTRLVSSLIFGRSDTCDIAIDDIKLSRQHFAFEAAADGEIYVVDLHSTNGTYLNGRKLVEKNILRSGDVISAGRSQIKVTF